MSIPSTVGLPAEFMTGAGSLDNSLPTDAKSYSVRIQPSNLSSIASPTYATSATGALDLPFPSQQLIFDLPCGSSPSSHLDHRFTTLNFRATLAITSTGGTTAFSACNLRSNANSFFDNMRVIGSSGAVLEEIAEYGIVNDTLIALQLANSDRDGLATQYGFLSTTGIDSQGHTFPILNGRTAGNAETEIHSYSVPVLSSVCGILADKCPNLGRTSRMQLVFQTTNVLPITVITGTGGTSTFTITLSDFSLGLEYVDIGLSALSMLDQTLVDGKAYIHGTTYRVATATVPAGTTGNQSSLIGIRASSVKSLIMRCVDGGVVSTTNSVNGKYDSKLANINSINWSIGGIKFPQAPINPLLNPAMAMRETMLAIGSWNNALYASSIIPANYCKLSAGGTAAGFTSSSTEANYTLGSAAAAQCQFMFGVNTEICMKRGLMSGYNATAAPIFLEYNIATANTNSQLIYGIAMIDSILIHDITSGDMATRV